MDVTGEYLIPAPRDRVWAALNDADVLRACIPGCEDLAKTSDSEFQARVTTKVGAIKATFNGRVILSDLDPPNGYTISGQGQGGAAGFARGTARVSLVAVAGSEATRLAYAAKAEVGGKLATVGSRLIKGVAAKTADEFFSRFSALMAEGAAVAARPPPRAEGPAQPPEHVEPPGPHIGMPQKVPPEPTVPYNIGQTERTQNRIILVSLVAYAFVVLLIFFSA